MTCELSIIVPVYNSQQYISRTIAALLTQEIEHYEIIIVDDGSTDDSPAICDSISGKYENIHCYHIHNSGPGRARNYGISKANGEYIAFCDSDDLPSPDMYGTLLCDMKLQHVEYAMCDIFSERDNKSFGFPWAGKVKFEGREVIDRLLASMLGNVSDDDTAQPVWGSSVRCIYKRELLISKNIFFPEDIRFAEDLIFNIRYIKAINSCYIRDEALYRYTFNADSLMNSHVRYNKNAFKERLSLVETVSELIADIPDNNELITRFQTSQRCYYIELVGNAARAIPEHGRFYALNEIKGIVNHPIVTAAFADFDAKSLKKRLSYWLIKKRCARILLRYFSVRLN